MIETVINEAALDRANVQDIPFPHLVLPHFIEPALLPEIHTTFPSLASPGLFPVHDVLAKTAQGFHAVIRTLESPGFAARIGQKFGLDLTDSRPMVTVRAQCQAKDGRPHTDSTTKLVSGLLYLNDGWSDPGGRLRLLRSDNLDDYAVEVPPSAGLFILFKRSDRSWHGHTPFVGPRRVIMITWMRSRRLAQTETLRHHLTAQVKQWRSGPFPARG